MAKYPSIQEVSKMKRKSKDKSEKRETSANLLGEAVLFEDTDAGAKFSSELNESRWSIVTFAGVAARGLAHAEALKYLENLDKQNVSGLCIVTDEAAARISKENLSPR